MTEPTHCIGCDALLFVTAEYIEQHGGICTACGEPWSYESLILWGDARIPKPKGILFSRPPELDDPERQPGYIGSVLGFPVIADPEMTRGVAWFGPAEILRRATCAHSFTKTLDPPYGSSPVRFCERCGVAQFPVGG
jgi:hypothetical protein